MSDMTGTTSPGAVRSARVSGRAWRRRLSVPGAAVMGVLVLAGCAPAPLSTTPTTAPTASTTTSSTTTTPVTTPSTVTSSPSAPTSAATAGTAGPTTAAPTRTAPTVASPATPSPSESTVAGLRVDAAGHVETAFATTAGGIVCAVSGGTSAGPQVRCDVEGSSWTVPPTPADCHGAWARGVSLSAGGAELTCVTDTVLADAAVEGPGTWWQRLPAAGVVTRADGRREVALASAGTVAYGSGSTGLTCRSDGTSVTCARGSAAFTVSKQSYSLR